jgi:hypothetical protein
MTGEENEEMAEAVAITAESIKHLGDWLSGTE